MSTSPTPDAPARPTATFGLRLLASCLVLVGLAFVQDPGLLAADTKLDLALAPADWLARALHLWDAEGAFGQLQNQAYGYLWPMGPFFLLGWLVDLPGWVVQRLWQGLVMSVALVGTAKVARALGVRSDLACLLAGFAFALSPRLLTTLGPISIEAWPSALAPWVLLPLVRAASHGSPRRAAALSALAVAMVGGVNAAATFAVLPLGIVWLLTRTPGPRRRALVLWWPLFTALGTVWWLVPLFVMGAYSPPFLDFIETTTVTTFPTTVFDALRGTSNWVPYVDAGSRAGNDLIRTSWVVVLSGVLLLLGVAGLLDRRTPHRAFLGLSLLVGVLMVTAGHRGAVEGWFAGSLADLLDGVLAPLRNVHKFDPIIRLPLVLGLGFVVDRMLAALREHRDAPRADRLNRRVLVGAAVLAVVGCAAPALQGRVQPAGATLGVPDYWQRAADHVAAESEGGTALLVPGSAFGEYVWGDTADEPMQWLADSRWAVRNVIPLTPPATIRMLDGIERRLAEGDGSPGLTAALRRAGVEHLVVRNDLERSDDVPDPVLVHQALETSPGIERVAELGPPVGGDAHLRDGQQRVLVNGGWQTQRAAVEVYAVEAPSAPAVSAAEEPSVLVAGPEDLPDLLDLEVLGEGPTVLAPHAPDDVAPRRVVLTDGLRERERSFARIHDGYSAVRTPGDVRQEDRPVTDYPLADMERWSTTARLEGARSVSASSSLADADAPGGSRRGALPYAALDGAVDTPWDSGPSPAGFPWWRVDLDEPLAVDSVTVTAAAGERRQRLRVLTEHGPSEPVTISPGGTRRMLLPRGEDGGDEVTWLRVEAVDGPSADRLRLAEVDVPGLSVRRVLDLPDLPEAWGRPDVVVVNADLDARTGCVVVVLQDRCAAGRDRASEDGPVVRRSFDLSTAGAYDVSLTARPRAGAALDRLVLDGQPGAAAASSLALPDPRAGAVAAIDGNPSSAWLAAPDDDQPELVLSWLDPRPVTGLDLDVGLDTAARLPDRVVLTFTRRGQVVGERELELGRDGRAAFPGVRADGVRIRVLSAEEATDLAFDGSSTAVPIGIGEVTLTGVPYFPLRLPGDEARQPCGSGPYVQVGPRRLATAVTASPLQLLRRVEVPAEPCGPGTGGAAVALEPGKVEVTAARTEAFETASVVLTSTADPGPVAAPTDAAEDLSGPVRRVLRPATGDQLVALRENANPGWVATQDGEELEPVVVDGWQQGFRLAGEGPVEVGFAPDATYRAGLLCGLLALLALVGVVVSTRRRWSGPTPAPLSERRVVPAAAVVLALAGAGLVAGTVGLVVGAATVGALVALDRRAPEVVPWAFALPVLLAATAYAVTPWGSSAGWAGNDGWVGYLSVVPLVAVVAAVGARRFDGTSRLSRIAGTSRSR